MQYLKSIKASASIQERRTLVEKLVEFASILAKGSDQDVADFKVSNQELYIDFLPWVLVMGVIHNKPSLVKEVITRDPEIKHYDFYEISAKIIGLNVDIPASICTWKGRFLEHRPMNMAITRNNFELCKIFLDAGFKCRFKNETLNSHSFDHAITVMQADLNINISNDNLKLLIDDDLDEDSISCFFRSLRENDEKMDLSELVVTKAIKGGIKEIERYLTTLKRTDGASSLEALDSTVKGNSPELESKFKAVEGWLQPDSHSILKNFPPNLLAKLSDDFFEMEWGGARVSTLCFESITSRKGELIDLGPHHSTLQEALKRQKTEPLMDPIFRELLFYISNEDAWIVESTLMRATPDLVFGFAQECRDRLQVGKIGPLKQTMDIIESIEISNRIEVVTQQKAHLKTSTRIGRYKI